MYLIAIALRLDPLGCPQKDTNDSYKSIRKPSWFQFHFIIFNQAAGEANQAVRKLDH